MHLQYFDSFASLCISHQSPTTSKSVEITGYICGYLASVFYLCSRFPQLYKNVSDRLSIHLRCGVCFHFVTVTWFAREQCHDPDGRSCIAFAGSDPRRVHLKKTAFIISPLVINRGCVFARVGLDLCVCIYSMCVKMRSRR